MHQFLSKNKVRASQTSFVVQRQKIVDGLTKSDYIVVIYLCIQVKNLVGSAGEEYSEKERGMH